MKLIYLVFESKLDNDWRETCEGAFENYSNATLHKEELEKLVNSNTCKYWIESVEIKDAPPDEEEVYKRVMG